MGKKGRSWFSTIKRVFSPNSNEKPQKVPNNRTKKIKERGTFFGNGEKKSLIPFFRQPSSIEKILEEAEKSNSFFKHNATATLFDQREKPPSLHLGLTSSSSSSYPVVSSPHYKEVENIYRPEPNLEDRLLSAVKIQTAYRGFMARRQYRTMKGVARLQKVVKGQNVKRQTFHAIKKMQIAVKAQAQIHSHRIQSQLYDNMDKQSRTTVSKFPFNQLSETGERKKWDNSSLIKGEETEGKMQKKVEASMKRERAMAYGYSHQIWKTNSKGTRQQGVYPGGYPWWWNRMESQKPSKSINQTPTEKTNSIIHRPQSLESNHQDSKSIKSTKSTPPLSRARKSLFPSEKTPATPPSINSINKSGTNVPKYSRSRTLDALMKDDDSLASCPPFSVKPNYMSPTVSTVAKRRFSLPLSSHIGSFKWNSKGSSNGSTSVNSINSMPAAFGRKKGFNRYV